MFKLKHSQLAAASGVVWLATGFLLLQYGIRLLISAIPLPVPFKLWTHPFLEILSTFMGSRENAALLMVAGCLITGKIKCRYVLSRSVRRGIDRLLTLPNPSQIFKIYSLRYYLFIGFLLGAGYFMRNSGMPADFRAACYMSIGCGMINGALLYFKASYSLMVRNPLDKGVSSVDLLN
jgi:hypothetical protein